MQCVTVIGDKVIEPFQVAREAEEDVLRRNEQLTKDNSKYFISKYNIRYLCQKNLII